MEADSDGDGYADGPNDLFENEKYNDPRKLYRDVFTYNLRSTSYVSINDGLYYGGNQSWFQMYNYDIACAGCGLIAAADSLIYLEQSENCFEGLTGIESIDNFSMDDYFYFVNRIYQYITPTHLNPAISWAYEQISGEYYSAIGILPSRFSTGLISYLGDHDVFATINCVSRQQNALDQVIDLIKSDIPVYAYAFSLDEKDKVICFS